MQRELHRGVEYKINGAEYEGSQYAPGDGFWNIELTKKPDLLVEVLAEE